MTEYWTTKSEDKLKNYYRATTTTCKFVRRAMSACRLNPRRRQSVGGGGKMEGEIKEMSLK